VTLEEGLVALLAAVAGILLFMASRRPSNPPGPRAAVAGRALPWMPRRARPRP
jgi:hypothetical protein